MNEVVCISCYCEDLKAFLHDFRCFKIINVTPQVQCFLLLISDIEDK